MRTVTLQSRLHSNISTAVLLASTWVFAPAPSVADVVITRDSVEKYVNVRAEPNASSEVIGELHRGKQVEFVASMPRWHEVTIADGRKGFVSSVWTKVLETSEVATTDEPESLVEETPAEVVVATDVPEPTPTVVTEAAANSEEKPAMPAEAPIELETADEIAVVESKPEVPETSPQVEPTPDPELVESVEPAPAADEQVAEVPPSPVESPPPAIPMPADESPEASGLGGMTGKTDYLVKFTEPTKAGSSRIIDDGSNVGIGTAQPQQALDVNGNVQIHNQSSNLVVLSLKQASGKTGYVTHNIAGTLVLGAGSEDRITVDRNGNVGIGMNRPRFPLEMASGAYVTPGGVWTNASSRDLKENIAELALEEALTALRGLKPVQYNYKVDAHDRHAGFIAEDVPDLVASIDRRGLSAMDIVAVLTTVVQAQQRRLDELEARFERE